MIKKIKELLGVKTIKWVANTQIERKHLEAETYLLVKRPGIDPMLFTAAQVKAAEKRAASHPEDCC